MAELRGSPEGQAWLAWLFDNDITVVDVGSTTAYNTGTDTLFLASDADATSLVHEATHAQWDLAGNNVDVTAVSREEYITNRLDGEVNSMVAEVRYLQATTEDPSTVSDQAFIDYTRAQAEALASGATPEEADGAGRAAIRELYTSGYYSPGNVNDDETTYMDYYGEYWDLYNP